eukprot:9475702-Pyramimonas_sp.AAC.1
MLRFARSTMGLACFAWPMVLFRAAGRRRSRCPLLSGTAKGVNKVLIAARGPASRRTQGLAYP